MKRTAWFILFVFFGIFGLLTPTAFSQTFTLSHCYQPSVLTQRVCINQDYLQNEFYVVLKNKPKEVSSFAFAYQVNALQNAVASGKVDAYHNELQRIERLPSVSSSIKNLATTQTNFDRILHIHISNPNDFITKDIETNELLSKFRQDPNIESISLSSVVRTTDLPYNDPLAKEQYMLTMIRAVEAHTKYGFGSPLAIVAIFDTGGTPHHPDLLNKYTYEHTTAKGLFISKDIDQLGHGTHVAGIAGAIANNNIGVVGICPECSLWNLKVLDDTGSGEWDEIVDGVLVAISKVDELKQQNPLISAVFNFSLSGVGPIPTLDAAFKIAYEKDIVIVAAASNEGVKVGPGGIMFYPAAAPGAIVAEAVDAYGNLASFSNYNNELISGECPGVKIYSTTVSTSSQLGDPSGYIALSGTSMAAPCMAGAIAYVRSTAARHGKQIRREIIHEAVLESVTPIPGHEKFSASGGVLDLISLHDNPLTPPGPVTEFGVFGTNWGSTYLAFTSVNDSLRKPVVGFLVSYSKNPFDEDAINRKDVTTIRYNIKRSAGEGVNLRIDKLEPETLYYVTVRPLDRALNIGPLPDNGILHFTTQKAMVFPGAWWPFTTSSGEKDVSRFSVYSGPLARFFEGLFEPTQSLWHLSDIISNPLDFRWNWWFGNPQTFNYKTSDYADSMIISPILDLTDMHYGAELIIDYFQQFLSLTTQTRDQFEIHAVILDENNLPLKQGENSVMLFQSIGEAKNSTVLRMTPIRMYLGSVKDLWLNSQKSVNDRSLDKFRVVFAFRFLSNTQGNAGGIGPIFGNIAIWQNP